MKQILTLAFFITSLAFTQLFAARGFFSDCPAFITVGGTFYEVGNCSATSTPSFHGTNLSNVSSFFLTYGEIQTFENSGDDVQNGSLYYRIWTGIESGAFTQVNLSVLQILGGGDERRSATTNINLLNGLLPSTTYTLEIYFQAAGNFTPDLFHSNGGANYELNFTTAASLPVSLMNFRATKYLSSATLDWQTTSELNNSYFEIQKSADVLLWQTIGEVKGNGTTSVRQDYSFTDHQPYAGLNYYRLKQVDFNGDHEISKVLSINFEKRVTASISPNPVVSELFIDIGKAENEIFKVSLFNLQGQKVIDRPFQSGSSLDLEKLQTGVYFIKITDPAGRVLLTEQLVKK